jgi:hypothetical protein
MKLRPLPKYTQLELDFNQNAISIQKKNFTKNGTGNKNCNEDWLNGYFQAKKDLEMQLNQIRITTDDLD